MKSNLGKNMSQAQQPNCYSRFIYTFNIEKNLMHPSMEIWSLKTQNLPHLPSWQQFLPRAAFVTSNLSKDKISAWKESFIPLITNISGQDESGNSIDKAKEAFSGEDQDYDEVGEDPTAEESEWDNSQDEYSGEDNSNDTNGNDEDENGGDENDNGDEEENGDDEEDNGDDKDDDDDENEAEQEDDDEECDEDVETAEQSNDEEQAASDNGHQVEIGNQVPQGQQPLEVALPEDMEEPMQEPMLNEQPANVEQPLPEAQQAIVNQEGLQNEQQELTDSSTDDEDVFIRDMRNLYVTLDSRLINGEWHDHEVIYADEWPANVEQSLPEGGDDHESDEDSESEEDYESDYEELPRHAQEQPAADNGHQVEIGSQVPQGQQPLEVALPEDMEEPMQEPMLNEQPANVEQPLPEAQQAIVNQEGLQNEQQELTDSSTDDEDVFIRDMRNLYVTLDSRLINGEWHDHEVIYADEWPANVEQSLPEGGDDHESDEDSESEEDYESDFEELPRHAQEQPAADNGHQVEIGSQVPQGQQPLEVALPEDMEEPMQAPMLNEQPANVEQRLPDEQHAVVNEEDSQDEQLELSHGSTDDEDVFFVDMSDEGKSSNQF